jgi:2-oxoglutarate ferredoxin oxidoreductase subunit delta
MDSELMLRIDKEKCKGCKLCIEVCPQKVLGMDGGVNKKGIQYISVQYPDRCTKCGLCALVCPDCAIEIIDNSNGD